MVQSFPLPQKYIDLYLSKMDHKITLEQRQLSRIQSSNLENILSLIRGVIDWHCKPQSSFKQKNVPKQLTESRSMTKISNHTQQRAASKSQHRITNVNNSVLSQSCLGREPNSSVDRKAQLSTSPYTQHDLIEQQRRQLKSKYQKYQPVTKSTSLRLDSPSQKESRGIMHRFKKQ